MVGVGVAVVAVVVVVSAVAADGLAIGEVVGVCPGKLIASATRQMQRRINFFILELWS